MAPCSAWTTSRRLPNFHPATSCSPRSPDSCRPRLQNSSAFLDAVPREFSYALQALIDKGGAGEAMLRSAEASDDSSDDDAAEEAAEEPAEATAEATEDNVADAGDTEDSAGEADGDNTEEE